MIDLHIHTTYSDGSDSVIEILKKAEEKKLEVISLIDHNNCNSYFELQDLDVSKYYSGKIINGIELNTSVLDVPIEILIYGIDVEKYREYTKKVYMPVEKRNSFELIQLKEGCKKMGIELPENFGEDYDPTGYASTYIQEFLKTCNNINIDKESVENPLIFYRKHISNPDSVFYIDPNETVPKFEDLIKDIRKLGGRVFLAHPYEYRKNANKILNHVLENCDIDGLECYHSSFTADESKYLRSLCAKKGLSISGGSDYHGEYKPNVKMGVVNQNETIPKDILCSWKHENSRKIIDFKRYTHLEVECAER